MRSPAVFASPSVSNSENFPTSCIWNCEQLGTWQHICWDCFLRPSTLHSSHGMGARFGWITRGESIDVATWGANVVEKIWSSRYDDARGIG